MIWCIAVETRVINTCAWSFQVGFFDTFCYFLSERGQVTEIHNKQLKSLLSQHVACF